MGISMKFLKTQKNRTILWFGDANPTSAPTETWAHHVYWLWYNSQDMEPAYMSTNKWMHKENGVYICNKYYPVVKNKIMVFVGKQRAGDYYVNHSKSHKYGSTFSHVGTYGWEKKELGEGRKKLRRGEGITMGPRIYRTCKYKEGIFGDQWEEEGGLDQTAQKNKSRV